MISKKFCEQILTLGCEYIKTMGGVARVLNNYEKFVFDKFNFISTTKSGNTFVKIVFLIKAYIIFIFKCLFGNIKIVHIHGSSYNSFKRKKTFIYLAKFLHKKVVYHIHGGAFHHFYEKNKKEVTGTLRKADAIIALSESWKEFFEQEVGLKNVYIIPNVTPNIEFINKTSNKKIKNITFLGTLCQKKGVYDIIEVAFKHKEKLNGKVKINLCGNGDIIPINNLITEYGISNIVECKGVLDFSGICKELSNSDIYLLPSYAEGLPISILEAMSYSLPVISTPVGGIPEVVKDGENGILITPGDKDALYNAIIKLANNEELRIEMGKISYKKVQPHFPKNVSKELETIYSELTK